MTQLHLRIAALFMVVALVAGCGASRSFGRGQSAAKAGNWDVAVEQYQHAVQEDPGNSEYSMALQRAMLSASAAHLDQARMFEARGQMDEALREYRRASEYDPPNRQVAAKVADIERRLRDAAEAARPRPNTPQVQAPRPPGAGPAPLANLNSVVDPARFNQANLRDVINTLAEAAGIQVQYERDYQDRTVSLTLDRVTLGEALQQVLTNSGNFYKVVNQRTILVIPDNPQKRQQYDEQVVQQFYLSHSDSAEVAATLNNILNIQGAVIRPSIIPNKTSNSITARAPASMMPLIERLVQMQDTPRAEVLVDLQIMEVSKARTRDYGLNLSNYAIQGTFSPEVDPRGSDGSLNNPAFNANTISRGISAADFYLAVPSAVVRFLENDQRTKVMAKPQLRGAEGATIRFNLGEEVPILSTAFTPIAGGGSNVNPLTSYTYRPVGIIVEMTPRVTYQDEITIELKLENSALGVPIDVAGQSIPRFTVRKVETKLRLREGESTLLAGLLQDEERTSATGLPGLTNLPIVKQLFAANRNTVNQTDVVMLLTPRIVRTHELTKEDLAPLFIGTQNSLGLNTPPPLIAAAEGAAGPAPAAAQTPGIPSPPAAVFPTPTPAVGAPTGIAVLPPGSSAVPGTTAVPAAAIPGQGAASGQIVVSPPSAEFRVGGGPYNVPISIFGASQISNVAVTVTYNPAVLRMRAVAEGSFMRSGGVNATFTQAGDATTGRVDIAIVRPGDMTGVAGTGLLAALLFEPVAPGQANLTVTATATAPSGTAVPLQYAPIPPVTVR
jgi:type II secretory pathway component GspD/PulD (secretin)